MITWHSPQFKPIIRIISIVTILCFVISNSAFALPARRCFSGGPNQPSQLRKEAVNQSSVLPKLVEDLGKTAAQSGGSKGNTTQPKKTSSNSKRQTKPQISTPSTPKEHPLLSVPIKGGTSEEIERVRAILKSLTSSIPRSHVVNLCSINIKSALGRGAGGLVLLTRPTEITLKVGADADINDIELRYNSVHEIGHIAEFNVEEARSAWKPFTLFQLNCFFSNAIHNLIQYLPVLLGGFIAIETVVIIVQYFLTNIVGLDNDSLVNSIYALLSGVMFSSWCYFLGNIFVIKLWIGDIRITRFSAPFVSSYATFNANEDFAETYTHYVLNRDEFYQKAQTNPRLLEKYKAMQKIFGDDKEETNSTSSKAEQLNHLFTQPSSTGAASFPNETYAPPLTRGGRVPEQIYHDLSMQTSAIIEKEISQVLRKGATKEDFEGYLSTLLQAVKMAPEGILRQGFQKRAVDIFVKVAKEDRDFPDLRRKLIRGLESVLDNPQIGDFAQAILEKLAPNHSISAQKPHIFSSPLQNVVENEMAKSADKALQVQFNNSCLAVVAYNTQTNENFVAHFSVAGHNPLLSDGEAESIIEAKELYINKLLKDLEGSSWKALIVLSAPDTEGDYLISIEDLKGHLIKKGISDIDIDRITYPDKMKDVIIDKGKAYISYSGERRYPPEQIIDLTHSPAGEVAQQSSGNADESLAALPESEASTTDLLPPPAALPLANERDQFLQRVERIFKLLLLKNLSFSKEIINRPKKILERYAVDLQKGRVDEAHIENRLFKAIESEIDYRKRAIQPSAEEQAVVGEVHGLMADYMRTLGIPYKPNDIIFVGEGPRPLLNYQASSFFPLVFVFEKTPKLSLKHVLLHEECHLAGQGFIPKTLDEGMTEYLTLKIWLNLYSEIDKNIYQQYQNDILGFYTNILTPELMSTDRDFSPAYTQAVDGIIRIINVVGEEAMLRAYLTGDESGLEIALGASTWRQIVEAANKYERATWAGSAGSLDTYLDELNEILSRTEFSNAPIPAPLALHQNGIGLASTTRLTAKPWVGGPPAEGVQENLPAASRTVGNTSSNTSEIRAQQIKAHLISLGVLFPAEEVDRLPKIGLTGELPAESQEVFESRMIEKIKQLARALNFTVAIHVIASNKAEILTREYFHGTAYVISLEALKTATEDYDKVREFLTEFQDAFSVAHTLGYGFLGQKGNYSVPLTLFISRELSSEGLHKEGEYLYRDTFGIFPKGKKMCEDIIAGAVQWNFSELDAKHVIAVNRVIVERYLDKLLEIAKTSPASPLGGPPAEAAQELAQQFSAKVDEYLATGALPEAVIWSKDKPSYIFLDCDNFLYKGTNDLVQRTYGEIYWRAKNGISTNDSRMPREEDLKDGIDFFWRTVRLAQPDHFSALIQGLSKQGIMPINNEQEYIELFERRITESFKQYVTLIDGAKEFLEALENKKAEGYEIHVIALSLASQFEVDLYSNHLGIRKYFDAVYGAEWGTTNFDKPNKIAEILYGKKAFVAMGGDSKGDVGVPKKLAEMGIPAVSFGTPTGTATVQELRESGAGIVTESLGETDKISNYFSGKSRTYTINMASNYHEPEILFTAYRKKLGTDVAITVFLRGATDDDIAYFERLNSSLNLNLIIKKADKITDENGLSKLIDETNPEANERYLIIASPNSTEGYAVPISLSSKPNLKVVLVEKADINEPTDASRKIIKVLLDPGTQFEIVIPAPIADQTLHEELKAALERLRQA